VVDPLFLPKPGASETRVIKSSQEVGASAQTRGRLRLVIMRVFEFVSGPCQT
jgi:hypothetical protein